MGTQFIEDPTTKERIPFEWDKPEPPTSQDIQGLFEAVRGNKQAQNIAPVAEQPNLLDKLGQRGKQIIDTFTGMGRNAWEGETNTPMYRPTLRVAGATAGAAGDIIGSAVEGGIKMAIPESIQENWKLGIPDVMNSTIGKYGMKLLQSGSSAYQTFKEKYPEIARDVEDFTNVAGMMPVGKGTEMATGQVIKNMPKPSTEFIEKSIRSSVEKGFQKGVAPSVAGKRDLRQIVNYYDKATEAVKDIVSRKDNMILTDASGKEITGKVPRTLMQTAEAVDQGKHQVFLEYDAMKNAAGEQGALIDLAPVINELKAFGNDKVLRNKHPELADRALKRAFALEETKAYTTNEAQRSIQMSNEALKAFYKNPSLETATPAALESLEAGQLRKALDNAIENEVGEGYQALKNKYGAYKAIEQDVAHRATVDARKKPYGFLGYADILTGVEAAKALATLSPTNALSAGVIHTIKNFIKHENNPNTHINKMFKNVENLMAKTTKEAQPSWPKQGLDTTYSDFINSQRWNPEMSGLPNIQSNLPVPTGITRNIEPTSSAWPVNEFGVARGTNPMNPLDEAIATIRQYEVPFEAMTGQSYVKGVPVDVRTINEKTSDVLRKAKEGILSKGNKPNYGGTRINISGRPTWDDMMNELKKPGNK